MLMTSLLTLELRLSAVLVKGHLVLNKYNTGAKVADSYSRWYSTVGKWKVCSEPAFVQYHRIPYSSCNHTHAFVLATSQVCYMK